MTNAFYSSKIKQRISMMNTGLRSGRRYKYAVMAPLTLISYILTNWEPLMSIARNQILIDATTNIVKFREGPQMDQPETAFKGIFVINGKVYTDEQIRDWLSKNGRLEFTFSTPPVLGMYTSNDVNAIRKWARQPVMEPSSLKPKIAISNNPVTIQIT